MKTVVSPTRQSWRKQITQRITMRFWESVIKRRPEPGVVQLNQRRIYTVPSRAGWMFILVWLLLLLTSTNYTLSLGFALSYILLSIGIVNVFAGFQNLAWLRLSACDAHPVFAGETALFTSKIENPSKLDRYAIVVTRLPSQFGEARGIGLPLDVSANNQVDINIPLPTYQRGWNRLGVVQLETFFPLGWLRAWSYWQPDVRVLVYPKPEENPPPLPFALRQQEGEGVQFGNEEFAGIRPYIPGDAIKHIAWKHMARLDSENESSFYTKQFSGQQAAELCIDLASTDPRMDIEARLSRLTAWVLTADQAQLEYEFQLGDLKLPKHTGSTQREQCLRALALYSPNQVGA